MSLKLHSAMTFNANRVRTTLGEMDVGSFTLTVTVSGRTLSDLDECKIEYTVAGSWNDPTVKGDSVENCLAEFARRKGWESKHAPLALAKPRLSNKVVETETEDA